jgi:hypothetical protein
MMAGMPRGSERANFKWRDADKVLVLQDSNAFRRYRNDFAPKSFHFVAVETRGRNYEFPGIDKMRRAARVDVNRRAKLRETPGGAGVIEMDMAEENMPDIPDAEASLRQLRDHGLEGRLRTGIEENQAVIGLKDSRGDDAAPAEMLRIEDVNHGGRNPIWGAQAASLQFTAACRKHLSRNYLNTRRRSARPAAGRCRLAACAPHYGFSDLGDKLGREFFGAVPRAVRGSNLSMVSQCRCRMA